MSSFRAIPFYIRVAASDNKSLAKYSNLTARTRTLVDEFLPEEANPPEGEVLVTVARRSGPKTFFIDPRYLAPWEPVVQGEVLVIHGPLKGIVGVAKAREGDQWTVTFKMGRDEFCDQVYEQKHIVGL